MHSFGLSIKRDQEIIKNFREETKRLQSRKLAERRLNGFIGKFSNIFSHTNLYTISRQLPLQATFAYAETTLHANAGDLLCTCGMTVSTVKSSANPVCRQQVCSISSPTDECTVILTCRDVVD